MASRHNKERQQGAVLITVMVFMAVLMIFASALINYFLTSEAAEVEDSLANVRTYWAMVGHVNYMLSRVGQSGVCSSSGNYGNNSGEYCTLDYDSLTATATNYAVASLQSYLDGKSTNAEFTPRTEIQNGSIQSPGSRVWYYPQYSNTSSNYKITVQGIVRDHGPTTSDNDDRRLRIDLSVLSSGSSGLAPAISGLENRTDRVTIGFCVVDDKSTSDGATPPTYTYNHRGCGKSPATADSNLLEGASGIQFIMRNAPIPLTNSSH